jgi:predicted molibdopterin-dependent oxidoreductase YjgC
LDARNLSDDEVQSFRKANSAFIGEKATKLTGINQSTIDSIAETIARSENAVIMTGAFFERDPWRDSLMIAATNLRRTFKNCKLVNMPDESNAVGADLLGALPAILPGNSPFDQKSKFEDVWHGPVTDMVGKDTIGILEAINEDEIECGFLLQADPVRKFPDGSYAHSVMEKLKLLIVIDSFMTDTARVADVILPLAPFAETEGTRTNWEGRLQYSARALKPLADSKPACEIIELLADRLGTAFQQENPLEVFQEMKKFLPGEFPDSFEGIPQEGVLLRSESQLPSAGLLPFVFNPVAEDEEYRFHLVTVNADHHRGTLTERADSLMNFCNESYIGMNVQDADKLKLSDGDLVKVESKQGKVVGKTKRIDGLQPGRIVISDNFSELQANLLMGRKERYDRVKLSKM